MRLLRDTEVSPRRAGLLAALTVQLACQPGDPGATDAGTGDSSGATDSSGPAPTGGDDEPTTQPTGAEPTGTDSAEGSGTTASTSSGPDPTTSGDTSGDTSSDTTATTTGSTSDGVSTSDASTSTSTSTSTSDTSTSDTSTSTTGADLDEVPPVIELSRPLDNVFVTSRRLHLVGQTSDDLEVVGVMLQLNDDPPIDLPITPGLALEFTDELRLARGWNLIEVTARDAADNSASAVVHVHLGLPVAAGGAHTLALADGAAWGFGRNNEGQLGAGDLGDHLLPTPLLGLDAAVSLAANLNHSLAVDTSGAVLAWGRNEEGQLGQGPGPDLTTATPVPGITDAVLVSAGQRHSLALDADGPVWSWGLDSHGQLGRDGEPTAPGLVTGPEDVVSIAAGGTYSLAVDGAGVVWAWGNNDEGQLGDGSFVNASVAKAVPMLDVDGVAAGKAHTLTSTPTGALVTWGLNVSGQLGDGTLMDNALAPVSLAPFADVLVTSASGNVSLALDNTGALWGWGQNFSGQLGLGDTLDRNQPQTVPDLPSVRAIATGLAHSVILDVDGNVWAWGLNSFGQLGKGDSGNTTNSAIPLMVALP